MLFEVIQECKACLAIACARRYTQMLEARHFGRDAEIQRPRMANYGSRFQIIHCLETQTSPYLRRQ